MWKYWWYSDPSGPDPWRAWYDQKNGAVQGRHDDVFRFLEVREIWGEPHTKKIDDFVEIILKTKVQHRLFGFYWPPKERFSFTFVLPCTHNGKKYTPRDAFETTRRRISELKTGSKWIRRCVRPE
jgi:hypothetical protein